MDQLKKSIEERYKEAALEYVEGECVSIQKIADKHKKGQQMLRKIKYDNLEASEKRAIINKAYDEIATLINKGIKKREAANLVNKIYGLKINEATVPRLMAQGKPLVYRERATRIAKHVEKKLADLIIRQRNNDRPVGRSEIMGVMKRVIAENEGEGNERFITPKWYRSFLKRWNLTTKHQKPSDDLRKQWCTHTSGPTDASVEGTNPPKKGTKRKNHYGFWDKPGGFTGPEAREFYEQQHKLDEEKEEENNKRKEAKKLEDAQKRRNENKVYRECQDLIKEGKKWQDLTRNQMIACINASRCSLGEPVIGLVTMNKGKLIQTIEKYTVYGINDCDDDPFLSSPDKSIICRSSRIR